MAEPALATEAVPHVEASPAQHSPVAPVAPDPIEFVRVLQVPVTALALGEGSRIALLADQPWLGDARGLAPKPFPSALAPRPGQSDALDVFFGRDNQPRVLGSRRDDFGERPIYWRHLGTGWRDGREEIARLAEPGHGALWGVLGAADPELVCRVDAQCIVKRRRGWTTMPAGPVVRLVTLQGELWSLTPTGIERLERDGWQLAIAAPAASEAAEARAWSVPPRAFWVTHREAWVSAGPELLHYREQRWTVQPSPVGEALSFWGLRADSLWVAGADGAAHYDGRSFRKLALPGPLCVVRGRSDREVWFGGDSGLFRASASVDD